MKNIYEFCPQIDSENFLIRKLEEDDIDGLYKIYSDKKAVPFFNSDNCHGDDFYYKTKERVKEAIGFWKEAYLNGWFVRFSVVNKKDNQVIGTIEAFHRSSDDYFNKVCLLRLDLLSDYEQKDCIKEILCAVESPFYDLFNTSSIVTKGFTNSLNRIQALNELNYQLIDEPLVGSYDKYFNYYEKKK